MTALPPTKRSTKHYIIILCPPVEPFECSDGTSYGVVGDGEHCWVFGFITFSIVSLYSVFGIHCSIPQNLNSVFMDN